MHPPCSKQSCSGSVPAGYDSFRTVITHANLRNRATSLLQGKRDQENGVLTVCRPWKTCPLGCDIPYRFEAVKSTHYLNGFRGSYCRQLSLRAKVASCIERG